MCLLYILTELFTILSVCSSGLSFISSVLAIFPLSVLFLRSFLYQFCSSGLSFISSVLAVFPLLRPPYILIFGLSKDYCPMVLKILTSVLLINTFGNKTNFHNNIKMSSSRPPIIGHNNKKQPS